MSIAPDTLQERRLVTVLFADIVGFTALADTLDPEELQELMAGIFQSLSEETIRFDGTIEKFIGDAIFVVFGAPIAHEDDAQRALRTALAMQRKFAEHAAIARSRYGRELGLRIGVHSGIVVAGHVRSPTEYGVMGDTVNVASRLQQHAQPGEVLVTQATFRLASAAFSFREVGTVALRGREQPVLAYALTGEREVARPSLELSTPLVGRWMELSRLELAYDSALLGRTEFVALSGEPGVGKSRLVLEFLGLVEIPREGTVPPLALRWTYASTGSRSYAGFIETLYEAFGVERAAPEAAEKEAAGSGGGPVPPGRPSVEKEAAGPGAGGGHTTTPIGPSALRGPRARASEASPSGFASPSPGRPSVELVRARLGEPSGSELASFLGLATEAAAEKEAAGPGGGPVPPGRPSVEGDAEQLKRRRYAVVAEAYATLARERPVVVVLEDLHHADSASLELLAYVLAHPPRARLLFLLTYRRMPATLADKRSGEGEGLRPAEPFLLGAPRANFQSLVLEPLREEEAERVVDAVLEGGPPELRGRIVARAGGNPFFIEESIRALIESGAVVRDGDGWRVVRATASLEIPATVHAAVAARIDRLPPLARECLQVAAVIGPRFGLRVLRESAGAEVADAVEQLIDADLVVVAAPAEGRLGRYRFKHAITQEVAYQTLLVKRRVELHRRVAEAIERVYAADLRDLYPVLAQHELAGEVLDRAARYFWKAAESAREQHAHGEAVRHAEQAATLFERLGMDEDAVRALVQVGQLQRFRGDFSASVAAYQHALELTERADPRGARARELYGVIAETAARWGGDVPDLEGFIARGLELVGPSPSRERALLLVARAFSIQRVARHSHEDLERALEIAREALAVAEAAGSLREVSICLDAVGFAERHLGQYREALATHERRVPLAQTLQESDELIDAHVSAADCLTVVGPLAAAIAEAGKARELAARTGKDQLRRVAIYAEARARLLSSDFAGVLAVAREMLAVPAPRDSHYVHALAFGVAAATAMNDPVERELRDALAAAEARAGVRAAADVLAAFYGARPAAGAFAAARAARWPSWMTPRTLFVPLLALVAAREHLGDDGVLAEAQRIVERTGHERGKALLAHARGALVEALAAYERLGLAFEQALCLADLGRRDEAKALAERIGAAALAASLSG